MKSNYVERRFKMNANINLDDDQVDMFEGQNE
jgi:hypothetical protein